MRIIDVLIFVSCFAFLSGTFILLKAIFLKSLYKKYSDKYTEFKDFMFDIENYSDNKIIKWFGNKKYKNEKKFIITSILGFCFLVLIAFAILIAIFLIKNSDYNLYLYVKL